MPSLRSRARSPFPRRFAAHGLLLASACLAGAGGCGGAERQPEANLPKAHAPKNALLSVATADLPSAVRERYRVRPDRRLLAALEEVQRLLLGGDAKPVAAERHSGGWRILAGDDEVGALPEFPTFEAATELLVRFAGSLQPSAAPSGARGTGDLDTQGLQRAIDALDPAAILGALASAPPDSARDPAALGAVTRALAWLATLSADGMDQADGLHAAAWAWLALGKASGVAAGAPAEVLVARALGYEAAAARASAALADDDPVRLYASCDATRLGALCAGRPADRPCHFLHLALLAQGGHTERFRAALLASPLGGETSLPVLGLEVRLGEFDAGPGPGHALAELALGAVARSGGPAAEAGFGPGEPAEARTRELEAGAARAASGTAGHFLAATGAGFYRAAFYTGLLDQARFFLQRLGSGPAALDFAATLAEPAPGTAEELRRWIELRGRVVDGATEMQPLAEMLESARAVGAPPLLALANTIQRYAQSTDRVRRSPMPSLFARLDARPFHLAIAAWVASGSLTSPGLFEEFARAAADAAPHLSEELPAMVARMDEDAARLREIVDDPAMPSYAQVVALDSLARLGATNDAFVRARYEALAEGPDGEVYSLVYFLETRGDLAGASAAVGAAIDRQRKSRGRSLLWANLRAEQARLERRLGRAERAFAVIEPALPSGTEAVLLEAGWVELARGRAAQALELGQAALDRYPRSSEASGLIACARWRLGDPATAARELAASRNGIVGDWNRHLPEGFAHVFAEGPVEAGQRAFAELKAAGIAPHVLAQVAIALGRKRGLEVALPLLEGLRDPAPEWHLQMQVATHALIRETSGAEAAVAWLRETLGPLTHQLALTLHQSREYDLVAELFPNAGEGKGAHVIRVLKAASLLHLRETGGARWDDLVAEIGKDLHGGDSLVRTARYFVGLSGEEAMHQPVKGVDDLADLGWAMGVKAASQRRFADADAWFQVALESGANKQPPYAFSWMIESDWLGAARSLAILSQAGAF
jgi:tetratricopeptide (TPR) repeat protein